MTGRMFSTDGVDESVAGKTQSGARGVASPAGGTARDIRRGRIPGWSRLLHWLCIGCASLWFASANALADYKLQPGDILGLTIVGMPDLATKAMIDGDGKADFPLAGEVSAAGFTVAEVRAKLQAVLPSKELTTHLADGREVPLIIAPVQINLAIAEYRPVYVDGDVAKSGAVAFRPGLTVRQAVSLAGGLGVSRTKAEDPVAQTLDLTGQYNQLTVTYAMNQARVVRLQGELDGRRDVDPKLVADLPVAPALRDQIVSDEQQLMATRLSDLEKERAYLASASAQEQHRADILNQQEGKDNDGVKIDEADLQRLEDLFKKGAIALPTLSEARRTVLQSSTRALQTTATLASVQRDRNELDRRLEKLGDARRTEILSDLAEARGKLAATRAELQSVSKKLQYAGLLKPQTAPGLDQVKIVIIRHVNGALKTIPANLDADLEPGDALQVTQPELGGSVATQ